MSVREDIIKQVSALDPSAPILHELANVLNRDQVSDAVRAMFERRNFNIQSTNKLEQFREIVTTAFQRSTACIQSKLELIETLADSNNLIPPSVFEKNWSKPLSDLLSTRLTSNDAFIEVVESVASSVAGSKDGKAEYLMTLLTTNSGIEPTKGGRGDISVRQDESVCYLELKARSGSLSPKTKARRADDLRTKYFRKLKQLVPSLSNSRQLDHGGYKKQGRAIINQLTFSDNQHDFVKGLQCLAPSEALDFIQSYLTELYPNQDVECMASELYSCIGDEKKVGECFFKYVAQWYRQNEGFNSLVLFDPTTMRLTNIIDFAQLSQCRQYFSIRVAGLKRGSDTQAVDDGFVNITATKGTK